jgi:hypothetical protein
MLIVLGPVQVVADCLYPIALWKLEESGAAPEFQDAVSPGYHIGACREASGAPVCPAPEQARYGVGQRFYVGGQLSGIDIPSSAIFNWDSNEDFSLSFWMKRDNSPLTNNEVIIGRDSEETGNDLHWWIGLNVTGDAEALFRDISGGPPYNKELRADKLLTDNRWHFIVFVRNGARNESRLYVDGHLEDKIYVSYGQNAFIADTTPINIGWIKLDDKYQYKGIVDEIALYDKALPQWFIHDRYYADERYTSGHVDPCN